MVQFTEFDERRNSEDLVPPMLDDVRAACDRVVRELKDAHEWQDSDFRITNIHRLRNVIQSSLAIRVFQWVIFPNDNFWKTFFQGVPSSAQMEDHFRELDMMARFALLHGMFSALEADMRDFVRRIDPQACSGGKAGFASIKSFLFARAASGVSYEPFMELVRLTRNTIHNNGVHHPENGKDAHVDYANRQFRFVVGAPVEFAGWDFVAFAGNEILALLRALANDDAIVSLPAA